MLVSIVSLVLAPLFPSCRVCKSSILPDLRPRNNLFPVTLVMPTYSSFLPFCISVSPHYAAITIAVRTACRIARLNSKGNRILLVCSAISKNRSRLR
jgi:hypothetical protein